jgi:hypothetical protein
VHPQTTFANAIEMASPGYQRDSMTGFGKARAKPASDRTRTDYSDAKVGTVS